MKNVPIASTCAPSMAANIETSSKRVIVLVLPLRAARDVATPHTEYDHT
jgi:hypothetical protein